ncbi:helix-turn-helix domain-containing protein [Chloroflexota bacterium]
MKNTKSDNFWCHACLDDKPIEKLSFDSRYCRGCCEFLLNEARMLSPSKHPAWIPKPQDAKKPSENLYQVPEVVSGNMSTVNDGKYEVDIFKTQTPQRTLGKRGPKQKDLPQELIERWADEGMGSKAIASRLNGELGIKVSYKTIQRVLSRGRELVLV